jgi:hypothetical protein
MSEQTTTRKTGSRGRSSSPGREAAEPEAAEPERHVAASPSLPVPVPEVHLRRLPLPRLGVTHVPVPRMSLSARDSEPRQLPDRETGRWLWYGGLAGLAVVGVIEWPVAGVVAAGTYLVERRARAAEERARREPPPVNAA